MNLNRFDRFSPSDYAHAASAAASTSGAVYDSHQSSSGMCTDKDGQLVGQGLHWRAGEPHAEINVCARPAAAHGGATAYVTLEPCCHYGKTGRVRML